MSDNEQPRNDAGQYTSEPKFGRAAELEAAGYTEMPDAPVDDQNTYGGDEDAIRAAADELASHREDGSFDADSVEYRENGGRGELIDERQAVTVEKAARDLSAYHDNTSRYVDGMSSDIIASAIDSARGDLVKADPKLAEAYGLDADEVAANAKAAEDRATTEAKPAKEPQDVNAEPSIEGLDPEVQKALKHPQVRQAIEDELGKAETAKQSYTQALNMAQQYAQASLLDHFPELQEVPVDRWAEGIAILNQTEPDRVQRAMTVLQRVDQLQYAQSQWQQHQAAQQRQHFESYAKAEDARFEELTKSEPMTKELGDAVIEYAESLGVDRGSLVELMKTNPIMRNAAFQRMMLDAARYSAMKKAVPKAAPKHLPPVQRPGTRQARAPGSQDLGALSARLSASGHIDDALSLLSAQRAARR